MPWKNRLYFLGGSVFTGLMGAHALIHRHVDTVSRGTRYSADGPAAALYGWVLCAVSVALVFVAAFANSDFLNRPIDGKDE